MMSKFYPILSALLLWTSLNAGAQTIRLSPQVIASQGQNFKNNEFEISYTIGELSAITTLVNTAGNLSLTQGFHQPDKFSVVIGIHSPENQISAQLFPNPAGDRISLEIQADKPSKYLADLFDASGRRVMVQRELIQLPGTQQFEFSLSDLAAGTYLLRLISADGEQQQTFRFTRSFH